MTEYSIALGMIAIAVAIAAIIVALVFIGMMVMTRSVRRMQAAETSMRKQSISLKEAATHDPLTKIANRALFTDRLTECLAMWKRGKSTGAVLLLDLDHFKQVNDTLGHVTGDYLLKQTASRLDDSVQPCDTAARLGGDEFAVILQEADEGAAVATAKRILRNLAEPMIVGGQALTPSVSIGIAIYPRDGNDQSSLMDKADKSMYAHKHSQHAKGGSTVYG